MVKVKDLTDELFEQSRKDERCPHIRRDGGGAYCARDLKEGEEIPLYRRCVCDNASLQLWCLTKQDWTRCIFFKGEPFTYL